MISKIVLTSSSSSSSSSSVITKITYSKCIYIYIIHITYTVYHTNITLFNLVSLCSQSPGGSPTPGLRTSQVPGICERDDHGHCGSHSKRKEIGENHFEHWVYGADDWEVVVLVMIILCFFYIDMRNCQFIDD